MRTKRDGSSRALHRRHRLAEEIRLRPSRAAARSCRRRRSSRSRRCARRRCGRPTSRRADRADAPARAAGPAPSRAGACRDRRRAGVRAARAHARACEGSAGCRTASAGSRARGPRRPQRVLVVRGREDDHRIRFGASARITPKPSMTGIWTSRNTSSGSSRSMAERACAPSAHSPTTSMSGCCFSNESTRSRAIGSSSTIRVRIFVTSHAPPGKGREGPLPVLDGCDASKLRSFRQRPLTGRSWMALRHDRLGALVTSNADLPPVASDSVPYDSSQQKLQRTRNMARVPRGVRYCRGQSAASG